jgi:preprotein translocase subunit SecE
MADSNSTEAAKTDEKKLAKQKVPKGSKPSFKGISSYFKNTYAEIKKIIWPTPKQVFNNTLIVILAILIVGAFIWGIDAIFSWPIQYITPKA